MDDTSSEVQYTGTWSKTSSTKDYGKSISYNSSASAGYKLNFVGTSVEVYIRKTPTSGIADVLIDGVSVGKIDGYAATTGYQRLAFDSAELTRGAHTIEVRATGTRSSLSGGHNVILDALLVEDTGPVVSQPPTDSGAETPGSGNTTPGWWETVVGAIGLHP